MKYNNSFEHACHIGQKLDEVITTDYNNSECFFVFTVISAWKNSEQRQQPKFRLFKFKKEGVLCSL